MGESEAPGSPFIDVEAISSDEDEESNVIGQNVTKTKGGEALNISHFVNVDTFIIFQAVMIRTSVF